MRVGCLLIPDFQIACELVDRPALARRSETVAIVDDRLVQATSRAAQRYGVWPGQRLQEALSRCPRLVTIEARPHDYAQRFATIVAALRGFSPHVESGPLGVAYVDLGGLWRHYPAPGSLEQLLLGCAPAHFKPQLGIGSGKFLAFVAAGQAEPGAFTEIADAAAQEALAEVGIEALPVDDRMLQRLRQLGLTTLGALVQLPRHAVVAQFGMAGGVAWDLASGRDTSLVRSEPEPETVTVAHTFESAIQSREVLLAKAEQLVAKAAATLAREYQAVRRARLRIVTADDRIWEKRLTFKASYSEHRQLWRAVRPVLEHAECQGAVSELVIELSHLTQAVGWQSAFWDGAERQQRERLSDALRQIKSRYGFCPVGRIVRQEPWSRIPERRMTIVMFDP